MTRTDTAFRTVPAPTDSVYAAFVDAEAMCQWLPPSDMTGRFERFDARPGGGYRMVLTYTDDSPGKATADSDVVEARFLELVPGVRVVQALDFESEDPAFAGTMTMTWELTPTDAGTHVEIRAENVPDGIPAEDHAVGLNNSWRISQSTSTGSRPRCVRPSPGNGVTIEAHRPLPGSATPVSRTRVACASWLNPGSMVISDSSSPGARLPGNSRSESDEQAAETADSAAVTVHLRHHPGSGCSPFRP